MGRKADNSERQLAHIVELVLNNNPGQAVQLVRDLHVLNDDAAATSALSALEHAFGRIPGALQLSRVKQFLADIEAPCRKHRSTATR